MEIRNARPEDVPAVLPMVRKLCALHESWDPAKYGFLADTADKYDGWLRKRAADPRSVFLVAERSATSEESAAAIAGFLIATMEKEIGIYRIKEFGFIHDLWVDEEYRHEGLARQMVMLAVERFKAIGAMQVRLDTAANNDPARALFATCGFRPSVVEMLLEIK
jgi:ribosomal protein S18 acetylase RimI-like enzyme